jgi:WD40 repeat protein
MDPDADLILETGEHTNWVMAVCAYTDSSGHPRLATGGDDAAVRVWDPVALEPVGELLAGHDQPVRSLIALGPPGVTRLLSGSVDRTVRIWDPETGDELQRIELGAPVCSLAALGDAAFVAGTEDGHVVIDLIASQG